MHLDKSILIDMQYPQEYFIPDLSPELMLHNNRLLLFQQNLTKFKK